MSDGIKKWIEEMLGSIVENAGLGKTIENNISKTYGILDDGGTAMEIMNAIVPVGMAICILFFLLALNDLAMSDRMNLEMFIKFFSKLAIGAFFCMNCKYLVNLGLGLTDWVKGIVITAKDTTVPDDLGKIDVTGLLSGGQWILTVLAVGLIGLVLQLAFAVAAACAMVACFSRIMEIGLRTAFLPIAIGFVSEDGWKGAGGRYLKKYMALCVQGPAMIVIAKLQTAIITQPLKAFIAGTGSSAQLLTSVIPLIGITFATVGLLFKSIGVINDVFGV